MNDKTEDPDAILETEDLKRVFIRAQDSSGKWCSLPVDEVTDQQFDEWAHTRAPIHDENGNESHALWPLEDRVGFCQWLYSNGLLSVLRKEMLEDS